MIRQRALPLAPPQWIEVGGFKSIRSPARIDLRPLTLLAGANSSGKSSALQPLLLLKQSLEVPYDPDPLYLDGPHVAFTSLDQLLSRGRRRDSRGSEFYVAFGPAAAGRKARPEVGDIEIEVKLGFMRRHEGAERLRARAWVRRPGDKSWIAIDQEEPGPLLALMGLKSRDDIFLESESLGFEVWARPRAEKRGAPHGRWLSAEGPLGWVRHILHLPGHRGHRERRFPTTKVTPDRFGSFSVVGPMHPYAASLLLDWKRRSKDGSATPAERERAKESIGRVNRGMESLKLTWKVDASAASAAEIQLRVGRMPGAQQGGAQDLVDIADVGFGVSQVLPVLVALAAAAPGQMVLIEQPELHLHPRAQLAMGRVLAGAAGRGVIVVVETHSQLILRAIQTVVAEAEGELGPEDVGLHWFSRDAKSGWSSVKRAELKRDGSFGDWPTDFPDVYSMADKEFIDAVFESGGPE